jgi:transposase
MGQGISVQHHLSIEEIEQRLTRSREAWRVRRWLVIRHALVDPAPAGAIGRRLGLSVFTVRNLIQAYNRQGPAAIDTPGRGQRQRAYLQLEEERAFLEPFIEKSRGGHWSTARALQAELEKMLGHPVAKSTVYRMLHRHEWRKLVPRPKHPKSTEREQEQFKKT